MVILYILVLLAILFGPIILANVLARRNRPGETRLFHWLLALSQLLIAAVGLLVWVSPLQAVGQMSELMPLLENVQSLGQIALATGLWGLLASFYPFRWLLARFTPLDPGSPVHTLALVLLGYFIGGSALPFTQQGDLEDLVISDAVIAESLALQAGFLVVISFLGVGALVRRNWRGLMQRLGLERPTLAHLLLGAASIVVLVILQAIVGLIWQKLDPQQSQDVDDLLAQLLQNFDTVGEWLLLALSAGVGEEILFRGALQPRLGLGLTAVAFALAHLQYGFLSPAMVLVFFLGLALGIIRRQTNTTTAIFVHLGYNFVLGLFFLLATQLEDLLPPT